MATAQANANLSRITATRFQELIKTDGVSKQEVDNAVGDLAAKEAIVNSAEANVRRLQELEGFKRVAAPFSGVITRRQTDIGQLVNAGNGGASQELFSLSQTDPLRVYVNVPESYAPSIHAGLSAFRAIVVDANHKLHLQPITIGRDYGTTLEVLQGISSSDWIVLNPADSLDDGLTVNVKELQQKPAPANSQPPPPANQGAKPSIASGAAH